MTYFNRTSCFRLVALIVGCTGLAAPAYAQLRVDITQGTIQPMPIAIPPLSARRGASTSSARTSPRW